MSDYERRQQIKAHRFGAEYDNRCWTNNDKQKLKRMYREGYGISEISIELKRSEVAIHQELYLLGCYPKKRREYQKRLKSCHCLCPECVVRFECEHYLRSIQEQASIENI